MATVKNNQENQFDINVEGKETIIIEAGKKVGDQFTAAFTEVDDADLAAAIKGNKVVAAWFDSGALEKVAPAKAVKKDD